MTIKAQKATLGGNVDGDVSIRAQDIVILPGAHLNGNLIYTAPNELILPSSVILQGELTRTLASPKKKPLFTKDPGSHYLFALAAWLTGLLFIGLFPHYTGATLYTLNTSRGLSSLIGFAALFLIPIGAILLIFTVVGLPLSMLLILSYAILIYLSKIVVALWLGTTLLKRKQWVKREVGLPLALGLLILYTLTGFSLLAMPVNLIILIFGLGALLLVLLKKPVLIVQKPDHTQPTPSEK